MLKNFTHIYSKIMRWELLKAPFFLYELKDRKRIILISFAFLLNLNFIMIAQNANDALRLSEPGIISNARALGMGNSYITLGNDYSSIIFNPAGLGLSKQSKISGGFYYRAYDNNSTFFGNTNNYTNSTTQLSQLGGVFPLATTRGSLVLAFGYQREKDFTSALSFDGYNPNNNSMIQDLTSKNDDIPFELGLSYPLFDNEDYYLYDSTIINGLLNQSGTIYEEGGINRWSFGASTEVGKDIFVGGSMNYLSGSYEKNREYYEDDSQNLYHQQTDPLDPNTKEFKTFFFNDILHQELSAWEFRLGFIFKWIKILSIGGNVKFPSKFTITENYYVDAYSEYANRYFIETTKNSDIKYSITTPFEFSLGASLSIWIFNVAGDVKFIDYTQMEFSDGLTRGMVSHNNKLIKENFRPVLNYHLGGEVQIPFTEIRGRIGAMYLPSPYDGDPENFDKIFFTAGAGIIAGDALSLDVAYSYGFWETYGDNYGIDQSRIYQEITSHTILITTTILF